MNRASITSLLGVALAIAVGAALEPPLARGAVAGALLAAAVGVASVGLQCSVARRSPKSVGAASVASFGLFLLAVLGGALLIRFVPALSAEADLRAFLLAFACLGFLLLVLGSLDVASVLREGSPT